MKKQLFYIAIFSVITLQACKKENQMQADNKIVHKQVNAVMDFDNPVLLDVDGNQQIDFSFFTVEGIEGEQQFLYLTAYTEMESGNKIVVRNQPIEDDWGYWAKAFNKDDQIGTITPDGFKWNNNLTTAFLMISETLVNNDKDMYGPWKNKQNTYLGIQIKKNGKTHYGWVRLSHVTGKEQIIVNDYAYNQVPDQPIKAGQL